METQILHKSKAEGVGLGFNGALRRLYLEIQESRSERGHLPFSDENLLYFLETAEERNDKNSRTFFWFFFCF